MTIYQQWLECCRHSDIPAISTDTAARLMAILLEYGNNEGFTYNPRFLADMDYIQKRFGLHEMGMVEPEFVNCLKKYVVELQEYQESHKGNEKDAAHPLSSIAPDWAPELLKARYNMKFIG